MAMDVSLVVNGLRYAGLKSVRVTRSLETFADSFAIEVTDRWGEGAPWPIVEEDECRIEVDGVVVLDGWVDKRGLSASVSSRTLTYTGRDRAGALVDCSVITDEWERNNVNVAKLAEDLARPFGVSVTVQPGLERDLRKIQKFAISPGDTVYEAIKRAAIDVLCVSDGLGGIVITRSGSDHAEPLVEGVNILSGQVDYDGAERFHRYVVATQVGNHADKEVLNVETTVSDAGVQRTARALMIIPDQEHSSGDAEKLGAWEAMTRAARAETATVELLGWKQSNGKLWSTNTLTKLQAPTLLGIDSDMLISQVEFTIGDQGTFTQLRLVRPDAFTPEPRVTARELVAVPAPAKKGAIRVFREVHNTAAQRLLARELKKKGGN